MGHWESKSKGIIHSIRGLSLKKKKKQEKAQINNLTPHLKSFEKNNKQRPEYKEGHNKEYSRNKKNRV